MIPSNTAVPKYFAEWREKVNSGIIPVCQKVLRQMDRIQFLIDSPDYYFDNDAVEGWIDFCENELVLTNGGDMTILESFKLWAEDALGWYVLVEKEEYVPFVSRPGGRIVTKKEFRKLTKKQYIIVSRGNAKTMYLYDMHAYELTMLDKTTHQLVLAPTEALAWETMSPFVTSISIAKGPLMKFFADGSQYASNSRARRRTIAKSGKGIRNFMNNSYMEFRPMGINKVQGFRGDLATVDEWLSNPIREDPINAIEQGCSKNPEYLIIAASSEGTIRNGPGDTIKMYLDDILNGKIFNPEVSIWWYCQDDISEVGKPETWLKSNPNLGYTIEYSAIQRDVQLAEDSPSTRNDIIAKRFGIPMEGITFFFTYEETLPHMPTSYSGMVCAVGLDASRGDDFWAVDFLFPGANNVVGLDTLCFITQSTLDQLDVAQRAKYDEFIAEGSLIVMNDKILKPDEVFDLVLQYMTENQYYPEAFGYDPYNAELFVQRWERSFGHSRIEKVIQGARTESVPLGQLKALAHDRALCFHKKIISFTMGNACVWEDTNGNRKLFKQRRDQKIDCVSAAVDALVAYTRHRDRFE